MGLHCTFNLQQNSIFLFITLIEDPESVEDVRLIFLPFLIFLLTNLIFLSCTLDSYFPPLYSLSDEIISGALDEVGSPLIWVDIIRPTREID